METRKKRRSKVDIERSIVNAAIQIIEEKGFSGITVTEILHKARVEPVVFYNRYDDLNDFISEFVKSYDYWFSDIVKDIRRDVAEKERYKCILNSLFISLSQNRIMQQLLKWELSVNNETSQRTAQLREFHTMPLVREYGDLFKHSSLDIVAVSSLIIGGLYYLILHNELSTFSGIDVNTDEGYRRIHAAINSLSELFFSELSSHEKIITIAKKMKAKKIDEEIIIECTGLSKFLVQEI